MYNGRVTEGMITDQSHIDKTSDETIELCDTDILNLSHPKKYDVAISQAHHGWRTENPEILKLTNSEGWSVAHQQAALGWTTENPEILKLTNSEGWSVAHEQATPGWTTENPEILKLTNSEGWSVAHIIIDANKYMVASDQMWHTENPEILKLANKQGRTVAHEQAKFCFFSDDVQILRLTDNAGISVAKDQVLNGWFTQDPNILSLRDSNGRSIAHYQAMYLWTTEDKDILSLADNNGVTVGDTILNISESYKTMLKNATGLSEEAIITIAADYGTSVSNLMSFASGQGFKDFMKTVRKDYKILPEGNVERFALSGEEDFKIWQRCRNADMSSYLSASVSVPTTGNKMRESSIRIK